MESSLWCCNKKQYLTTFENIGSRPSDEIVDLDLKIVVEEVEKNEIFIKEKERWVKTTPDENGK